MCLAIPLKILEKRGDKVIVGDENHNHKANLSLVKDVKVGDYVLVHGDMVLNKVEKSEALRIIKMVENLNG